MNLPSEIHAGLESLVEELGNTTVNRALQMFLRDFPVQIQELRRAADGNDHAEFKRMAHNLKGRCGMLALKTLRERTYAVELSHQGPTAGQRQALISALEAHYQELSTGLAAYQTELATRPA
jgi:HPt (histidine-containing phosphotransfer) domain-containing protein